VHAVAVIEKHSLALISVRQESMKPAVESHRKRLIVFIKVDEVRRAGRVHVVAALLQSLRGGGLGVFIAGKYEGHVSAFVAKRHAFGERALSGDPAHVHAERFVDPSACDIEILVPQSLHHVEKLLLRALARHSGDESNNSRHIFP